MITSYINKQFHADNKAAIEAAAQAEGIGNVTAVDLGLVFRVRGLNASLIPGAVVYQLPERGIVGVGDSKRAETDGEYRASVSGDLMPAIARVGIDASYVVVFKSDEANSVMAKITGWPVLVV